MAYDFNWESEVEVAGETLPPDSLMRAKYAASLSDHIVRKSVDGDYVLNLNAGWGHGKTYFLKRWFDDIKASHPAVYVNAWKHDFSQDPLLTVVSELKTQLGEQFSLWNKKGSRRKIKIKPLLKAMGPLAAKGLTQKLIGVAYEDLDNDYKTLVGDASAKIANIALAEHESQVLSISAFRTELSEVAEELSEHSVTHELPVFVFIDELDRCRPTFAIELLETVKHLFDVKEFVFVIATDTEQLEHSIKAIYGSGFDARSYLSRFFSERVLLPRSNLSDFLMRNNDFRFLFDYDDESLFRQARFGTKSVAKSLSQLFNDYAIPLRTTLKLLGRATFALNSLEQTRNSVDPLYLLLLLIVKESSNDYYSHLMHTVKPSYQEQPSHITASTFQKYSVSLIVEPEKLRSFSNSLSSNQPITIKLSDLFSLRNSESAGKIDFEKRADELRKTMQRKRTSLQLSEIYSLSILYIPHDLISLKRDDYNSLVEHSMLLE